MDGIADLMAVVGLFTLRLGVPLAITFAVAYGFKRLDARWETEAKTHPAMVQAKKAKLAEKPCWEQKGCSAANRANCPACALTDIPCWLARMRAEHRLPVECNNCVRYAGRLAQRVHA